MVPMKPFHVAVRNVREDGNTTNPLRMKTSDILKSLRQRGNLTQKNVADALGVSQQAVSAVEVGMANLDVTQLVIIAKLAGFEVVLRPTNDATIVLAQHRG